MTCRMASGGVLGSMLVALSDGRVFLPHALARKYPNADVAPGWQHLFPAARRSVDPRSGRVGRRHVSEETLQRVDGLGVGGE
ncbi:hypothetical protein XTPLMG730_3546 [Xanthomonas translucens pv. phlei]|uniref:Uncharacterized protein n=1 Tax=Xanthomonas graminis pv. phlei TaxID=487906 RepID=A0A0K3A3B9_9XANT|nr:hypothetical protein XTPLMG730_3546 [Xanthomonas translucens pv. phlei]